MAVCLSFQFQEFDVLPHGNSRLSNTRFIPTRRSLNGNSIYSLLSFPWSEKHKMCNTGQKKMVDNLKINDEAHFQRKSFTHICHNVLNLNWNILPYLSLKFQFIFLDGFSFTEQIFPFVFHLEHILIAFYASCLKTNQVKSKLSFFQTFLCKREKLLYLVLKLVSCKFSASI